MRKARNLNKKDIQVKDINRFLGRVKKNTKNCWPWTGYKDRCGYGIFYFNGVNIPAHRFSYLMHKGNIFKNLLVLHSCDNPRCVNPGHLSLGTVKDNIQDKVNRNRQYRPQGEKSPNAKLTEKQVREILKKQNHFSQIELGKEYNIRAQSIGKIINGERWKHIPRKKK